MVTLKDVAREGGVSVYTVSCALRNQRQIAVATRERIQALAADMGYQPNASASVLASRRGSAHSRNKPFTLGYFKTLYSEHWESYFEEEAKRLGFGVKEILTTDYANASQASRVLWHEGVQGLLLFTTDRALVSWLVDFDWSRFSVVKFSRNALDMKFHLIRHEAFDYALHTLERVFAKGYRRVAVLLADSNTPVDDSARLGAVLAYRHSFLKPGQSLQLRVVQEPSGGRIEYNRSFPEVVSWLREYRPEAVVSFPWPWYYGLEAGGFAVGEDFHFATMIAPRIEPGTPEIAGCERNIAEIIRRAVGTLDQMLRVGERGIVAFPREDVIEPVWREGASLPGPAATMKPPN